MRIAIVASIMKKQPSLATPPRPFLMSQKDAETSSESGSAASAASAASTVHGGASALELAARVHRKLGLGENEPLPVNFHRSALNSMATLHEILAERPGEATAELRQLLMFSGISVQRRILLGEGGEEEAADLSTTLTLLFVLVVLSSEVAAAPGKAAYETELLSMWNATSLWARVTEACTEGGTWDQALRLSPESVCRSCILEARAHAASATLENLAGRASTFFRASSTHLAYTLLGSAPVRGGEPAAADFLTLSAVDILRDANDQHEERLATLCAAAETEAGQQASSPPLPLVRTPRLTLCPLPSDPSRPHFELQPPAFHCGSKAKPPSQPDGLSGGDEGLSGGAAGRARGSHARRGIQLGERRRAATQGVRAAGGRGNTIRRAGRRRGDTHEGCLRRSSGVALF